MSDSMRETGVYDPNAGRDGAYCPHVKRHLGMNESCLGCFLDRNVGAQAATPKGESLEDINKRLTGRLPAQGLGPYPFTPQPNAAGPVAQGKPAMQAFETGATRSDDSKKNDYEGFLSPLVLEAYADYMTEHRVQDDGQVRASDNWQRGMPFHKYIKSLFRHFLQLWQLHRGYTPKPESRAGKMVPVTVTSAVSGILFNTSGYFHEYLMDRNAWENRIVSEPENADVLRAPDVRKQAA
jgi:hypothetical protein